MILPPFAAARAVHPAGQLARSKYLTASADSAARVPGALVPAPTRPGIPEISCLCLWPVGAPSRSPSAARSWDAEGLDLPVVPFPPMRRGVALLLLAIVLGFLGLAAADPCDASEGDCAPLCHASCVDGCATAPVPAVASSLPGDLGATAHPLSATEDSPLARPARPALDPPRA